MQNKASKQDERESSSRDVLGSFHQALRGYPLHFPLIIVTFVLAQETQSV